MAENRYCGEVGDENLVPDEKIKEELDRVYRALTQGDSVPDMVIWYPGNCPQVLDD
jgi:hypothetical protein